MAFTGWIVREKGSPASLEALDDELLTPGDGDVTVRVLWSGINYKDALALLGRPGVVRTFPLVPGIDFVGEVAESSDPRCSKGDVVVLTGAGAGEERHGGLAERAVAPGAALVAVPEAFSPQQAAAIGTAGFTAALAVLALRRGGVAPESGPVLVTGAGGGVGSVAVALLAAEGFEPWAVTGRVDELGHRLRALGAAEVLPREDVDAKGRPLAKQRWAGVIDSVGGPILASALAGLHNDGVAAACGLAADASLPGSVMPFILRGVSLVGIDSVRVTPERRVEAWDLLARSLEARHLDDVSRTVALADVVPVAEEILAGRGTGRTAVRVE